MSIKFGDGLTGIIVLAPGQGGLVGQAIHGYSAPGNYVASISVNAVAALAAAVSLSASASVAIAPARGVSQIVGTTLSWPDGSTHLHLAPPATVPQPIARVQVSGPVSIVAQWAVDGAPTLTVHESASRSGYVRFVYGGALPPSGTHGVGFSIISPTQPALAAAAPPTIGYQFGGISASPPPLSAYQQLHFDGFTVTDLHLTQSAKTYSGSGTAHVANLNFQVGFNGLHVQPDKAASKTAGVPVGDVTGGTAAYLSSSPSAQVTRVGNGGPVKLGSPCANSAFHVSIVTGLYFDGQIGAFQRDGYTFYLMAVQLEPVTKQSLATFCWPAPGVETADAAQTSGSFNSNYSGSQLILELANIHINEDGAFDDDIAGDKVGDYRLAYTPFVVEPTKAQTLRLRFGESENAPHAAFNGTAAVGSILQQVSPATVTATCSTCLWDPGGIDAVFSIDPGQSIYPAAPSNFKLTIAQSTLNVQGSVFLGGTMSGTFAAGQPAPQQSGPVKISPLKAGSLQSATSSAYQAAVKAAQSYNAAAQASGGTHFVRAANNLNTQSPGNLFPVLNPAGQFSGSFTAIGDLVATASDIGAYKTVGYTIAPAHGSLYVPGGEYGYPSSFEFAELFMGGIALSPLWNNIPQLNYSQPSGFVLSGVARFQIPFLGQIQGSVTQTKTLKFAGNAALSSHLPQNLSGPAQPLEAKPAFPWPGLYIDSGQVTTPYAGSPSPFADTTKGEGFGFAFTDGSGNSGLFSLQTNLRSNIGSFPLDMQLFNVEIVDDGVIQSSFWGVIQIPPPIAASLPVVVQQVNNNGALGAYFIPSGITIPLTAWNASMVLDEPTTVGSNSIAVTDGSLSVPHYSGTTHVQGALLATGRLQNDQLMPLAQQPPHRVAGLDFTAFSFGFPDTGNANVPVQVNGSGSIAGWSSSQQILTLVATGSGFAPPSGYHFGVSQSLGPVAMSADIAYAGNDAWNGSGKLDTDGFVNASFGLHVDDSTEQGQIGLNVPGGSGSSTSGMSSMTNIKGAASFGRSDGSLHALAFGATLNLSSLTGHAVVLYDTSVNDPLVQSLGGAQQLSQRGWDCSQAWCFAGSVVVDIDSNDNLSGELDGLFNHGFSMYANGTLKTPLATVNVQAQLAFFDNGEWDVGASYYPIDVLGVNFQVKACFWNHRSGLHGENCLDTSHFEIGFGAFIGLHADANFGDIINASGDLNMWASDPGGFGAHLDASGSAQVLGIGPTASASLDFSTSPLGLKGSASLSFCACIGSLGVTVGASWYDNSGLHLDDAGLSLGGPCGICNPANWF